MARVKTKAPYQGTYLFTGTSWKGDNGKELLISPFTSGSTKAPTHQIFDISNANEKVRVSGLFQTKKANLLKFDQLTAQGKVEYLLKLHSDKGGFDVWQV